MDNMCIRCRTRPITVKKWRRCQRCYQQYRRRKVMRGEYDIIGSVAHSSEIEFVRNFFTHKNWFYHPATFKFNGTSYQPDFYDGERNMFIEVSATSSAFYNSKEKYKQFAVAYPKINFELRYVNGDLLSINSAYHKDPEKRQK